MPMKTRSHFCLIATCLTFLIWSCNSNAENSQVGNSQSTPESQSQTTEPKPASPAKVNSNDKSKVRAATETLFKTALAGDFPGMAPLMAYRGNDKARKWKSPCRYKNEDEKSYVDRTTSKIQVILDGKKSHEFVEFIQETEREGTWHVWVVNLKYDDGSEDQKAFAFLKIDGKYLLGDID